MNLKKMASYLDQLLPLEGLTDYAPNGIQIEGKSEVKRVATAVTADLETIKKAVDLGVDCLIVHHGLFWYKDSLIIQGSKREKIALLLSNSISLLAYHLPLDYHREIGNNWKAAQDMRWFDLKPFGLCSRTPIGVKGRIAPIERQLFQNQLESYYGRAAHCAEGGTDVIETVALISGGAHRSLLEAASENIDAFVTGSCDEPCWSQAHEEKINFYALGHSATERVGPIALKEKLILELGLDVCFIDTFNPF